MKKKQIANLVMAAVIVLITAVGILGVGNIRGWFDTDDGETAILTDVRGIVNLRRDGVSFPVEDDTVLRAGDRITCDPGASVVIQLGDADPSMGENAKLTLGENAQLDISDPSVSTFCAAISNGEVFVDSTTPLTLSFEGREIGVDDTVALLSIRSGAQSIGVLAGTVAEASAGQIIEWVGDSSFIVELKINSLNDFAITQIRKANENKHLCFTNAQLDDLIAQREAEMQEQLNQTEPPETVPEETTEPTVPVTEATEATEAPTERDEKPTEKPKPTELKESEPTKAPATEPPATDPPATDPPAEPKLTCTISIRCDTILDNMGNLDPAKAGFVPSSGVILSTKTVEFTEGETVFDVLQRVCSNYGIQLEYSWTPMYNSYYIEGINHLYEFDCGSESGWMYKVNGWFPNYGCSSYTLTGGESIVWCYTCNGLGADVGA